MSSPAPTDVVTSRSTDLIGGALLAACSVVALVWANSPWSDGYAELWELGSGITVGGVNLSVHHVVNDALMAVFFFSVGLEITRELVYGQLRDRRTAALPVIAALGGMVVPAAIFAALNAGSAGARGWGIPMATDIAFALGVTALLGRRLPAPFRLFLLTLAVVDDLGAIVVIAIFYSEQISLTWLGAAALMTLVIAATHRRGVTSALAHALLAVGLWYLVFRSGVHATIAGVVAGMLATSTGSTAVAEQWERRLGPVVSLAILPIFALANAGVRIDVDVLSQPGPRLVALGALLGLVVGKFVGVFGSTWLAVRFQVATLPAGLRYGHIAGVAILAGMGFTVSLFVASLAFEGHPELESAAKVGVLAATVVAASIAAVVLARVPAPQRR